MIECVLLAGWHKTYYLNSGFLFTKPMNDLSQKISVETQGGLPWLWMRERMAIRD